MFKRWWWVLLVMAGIGPVLGLLTAAVVTYVMPRQYESRAVIEVKPRDSCGFYWSEADKIKCRNAFRKVIEKLDLTSQWGVDTETAIQMLGGMVTTDKLGGTDLISIRVCCTDKEMARDIAAAVVRCYKDYCDEIDTREVVITLQALKEAIAAQEKIVEERRKVLADLVRDKELGGAQSEEPAKRDFEAEQEMFQRMKAKVLEEEIVRDGGPGERVIVHDEPVIALCPVSPNVLLNLLAGTALGLLLALPLGLLVAWALERLVPKKLAH